MSVKRGVISPRLRNNTLVRHKRFNILKATFCSMTAASAAPGNGEKPQPPLPFTFFLFILPSADFQFCDNSASFPPPSAHRGASTLLLLLLIGSLRWVVGPPTYELTRCLEDWRTGWLAGCLGRAGWAERTAAVQKQTPPV